MLLHLALCIILLAEVEVRSFLPRGSPNMELKDDGVQQIRESVVDYTETLDRSRTGHRNSSDKENRLASKEYGNLRDTYLREEMVTIISNNAQISDTKSNTTNSVPTKRKFYDVRNYSLYDYNELVDEYDEETYVETRSNETYHPSKVGDSEMDLLRLLRTLVTFDTQITNCTAEELSQIGFKAIYCLYADYRYNRQNPRVVAARLWRIARIWVYVYLAVAIPFWCTKGWCCCCLFCKFFKPRQTIEEAKRYVANSPPGVLHYGNGGQTLYEPTEREIERFEELHHFIQTV